MSQPHALFIPYPLQGHLIPSAHLAVNLASSNFTVTFVTTESIHRQTLSSSSSSSIFASAQSSGLDIRYEVISDGLPLDFDRSLNHDDFMGSLLHKMQQHVEALAERLVSLADSPVTCLIADTFFVWPAAVAKRFGIPYVSFWTEPALVFTLYYHMDMLKENGHYDSSTGNRTDMITYIPGVDPISPSDLMSYLQDSDTSTVCHQINQKAFEGAHNADFIICNTVQELESSTISALQSKKPFYAIGPIFPQEFTKGKIATSLWTESDCTQWLDSKPLGSVLYVSFGSYAHISKKELEEIAYGVMDSNVNFVWVLRSDIVSSNEPNPLPKGFLEETNDRGLVVTWCRQKDVLNHKSVGGFLTHCGWNSILESIWSSIPLLCFPLLTDQFTNRKLTVKDWRIGIDLGGIGTNVSRKNVSEKICRLMKEKEGDEMRIRVKELRSKLEFAISPKGSSVKNFENFVEDLRNHMGGV